MSFNPKDSFEEHMEEFMDVILKSTKEKKNLNFTEKNNDYNLSNCKVPDSNKIKMDKIFVVIPAYEPDNKLIELCNSLQTNGINNIVVVNDGSTKSAVFKDLSDNFPDIIVLNHNKNSGKGRALKTAFSYLLDNADIDGCITVDADGQHMTKDILKCAQALLENPKSLVLGCRQFNWHYIPFKSKIGNRIALWLFKRYTNCVVSDTQTGLRGLPKIFLKECINLEGEHFEFEMNMLVTFSCKYNIKEVPITCVYNSNNNGTHFKALIDSLKVITTMRKAAKRVKKEQLDSTKREQLSLM